MGMRNYLIEGVSGAGKTAVCTELRRRGYQAIHGDRELRYQGDPETGTPTDDRTHSPLWDVEKVKAFAANQDEAVTFFCGGTRNLAEFIELLDGVFILEVDLDTCLRRIDERVALDPTDWGGKPAEREIIARLHRALRRFRGRSIAGAFGQARDVRRDVEYHPVPPSAAGGRIGVVPVTAKLLVPGGTLGPESEGETLAPVQPNAL